MTLGFLARKPTAVVVYRPMNDESREPPMPYRLSSMTYWREVLVEAGGYLVGSPRSRLHQLACLRALDDRLLKDIGLTRTEAAQGKARSSNGVVRYGCECNHDQRRE
jgi:uncharacterized protein DUF1127